MIIPDKITNFKATNNELEELIIFWIFAANNNGHQAAKVVNNLREHYIRNTNTTTFEVIRNLNRNFNLALLLQQLGLRMFNQKYKFLMNVCQSNLDLKKCSYEDLTKVKGIGPKTASCFLLHSRPNQKVAGLDVHMKRFLEEKGHSLKQSYKDLEKIVLNYAKKNKMSPAEFDLFVWKSRRIKI